MDAKTIEELRALLAKATPGPWEADNENNDGCYGLGDDCHEGFQSASIHAPDGRGGYIKLFDALNSDVACIEEEWDEDQHYAWDEVSRANAALIVAMRNALPDLLDAAERAVRHHNKSRAESSEALVAELREKVERLEGDNAFLADSLKQANERAHILLLRTRIRALTAENEAMRRERDEARESLHLANGTADLAIKHRDAAEKEAAIQKALAVEMAQALDAANADINQ